MFALSKYTVSIEIYLLNNVLFFKFRSINNWPPIEAGTRYNIPRNMHYCTFCESRSIGDEYHYILIGNCFKLKKCINAKCTNRPSALKMANLMNAEGHVIFNLCKFIEVVINVLCYVDNFVMFYSNIYSIVYNNVDSTHPLFNRASA